MLFFVTRICSKSRDLMISLEIICVDLCVRGACLPHPYVTRSILSGNQTHLYL